MFEITGRVLLDEQEQTGPHPRQALRLVEPPVPVEIRVSSFLPDRKPRWAERPIWLRVAGIDLHPVRGLLYAWVRSETNDWYGVVSMELGSRRGQLRVVLPGQLVPAADLRPVRDGDAGGTVRDGTAGSR
ncbi:hypothetical protein [Amycolatopsis sp. NBC_01480]|uniref:hypothetical protein n=1 Tax=Amycolatopsis sp. NBC_01480 TaxID=2903562 RepID=UPI002E2E05FE|nr:hypothetical protein [Amycolatopsis sp. NBC_01480]